MICVLAGGVGAARLLAGLIQVHPPHDLVAVVNVGDDLVLHGLAISPDLDTITYTLAGEVNPETGWGLVGETWQAMASLEAYGGEAWFRLKELAESREAVSEAHSRRLSAASTSSRSSGPPQGPAGLAQAGSGS